MQFLSKEEDGKILWENFKDENFEYYGGSLNNTIFKGGDS